MEPPLPGSVTGDEGIGESVTEGSGDGSVTGGTLGAGESLMGGVKPSSATAAVLMEIVASASKRAQPQVRKTPTAPFLLTVTIPLCFLTSSDLIERPDVLP